MMSEWMRHLPRPLTWFRVSLLLFLFDPSYGNTFQPYIIGGSLALPTGFVASVSQGSHKQSYCGAAFIEPNVLVTAAHCIENGRGLKVYLDGLRPFKVRAAYPHPDYDDDNVIHDLALLMIDDRHEPTSPIQPIAFDRDLERPFTGPRLQGIVYGFGNLSSYGYLYDEAMRQVFVDVIDDRACRRLPDYDDVDTNQICAGDIQRGGADANDGDSGGPLVIQTDAGPLLLGVLSWGYNAGQAKEPSVYSHLAAYQDWIDATIALDQSLVAPSPDELLLQLQAKCYDQLKEEAIIVHDDRKQVYWFRKYTPKGEPLAFATNPQTSSVPATACQFPGPTGANVQVAVVGPRLKAQESIRVAFDDRKSLTFAADRLEVTRFACKEEQVAAELIHTFENGRTGTKGHLYIENDFYDIRPPRAKIAAIVDRKLLCEHKGHALHLLKSKHEALYLEISGPQFNPQKALYPLRLDDPDFDPLELTFATTARGGHLTLYNPTDLDIFTYRLTCNKAFDLFQKDGTLVPPETSKSPTSYFFPYQHPDQLLRQKERRGKTKRGLIRARSAIHYDFEWKNAYDRPGKLKCEINTIPAEVVIE